MSATPLTNHELTGEKLTVLDHWRLGRLYRYPVCCIARFCIRNLLHDDPKSPGSCVRGGQRWAACGVFHKPEDDA